MSCYKSVFAVLNLDDMTVVHIYVGRPNVVAAVNRPRYSYSWTVVEAVAPISSWLLLDATQAAVADVWKSVWKTTTTPRLPSMKGGDVLLTTTFYLFIFDNSGWLTQLDSFWIFLLRYVSCSSSILWCPSLMTVQLSMFYTGQLISMLVGDLEANFWRDSVAYFWVFDAQLISHLFCNSRREWKVSWFLGYLWWLFQLLRSGHGAFRYTDRPRQCEAWGKSILSWFFSF